MTTSELYAIYAPAFEAAGIGPVRGPYALKFLPRLQWNWVGLNPLEAIAVDPEDAANACRCWAWDWIASSDVGFPFFIPAKSPPGGGCLAVVIADENRGLVPALEPVFGPTIHHALASAVVAVAEARSTT